jgi:hypothetical protein
MASHRVHCEEGTKSCMLLKINSCGPGSSVGIATGYGLDGPGIEFRWG